MQGHSSFKTLVKRYENEFIVATGKGDPALVMSEYGFKKVLSLDEYVSYFKGIDPVSQYKLWTTKPMQDKMMQNYDLLSEKIKAVFVISDPVDWGRDIQVICDILRSGGVPGKANGDQGQQPPLYFAADDLEYQAAFPAQRLGMGAFRIALESVFNRVHHKNLDCVIFGKPNPFVFKNAEAILCEIKPSLESHSFKTLYMIGDNPAVDVKGAKQAGSPWFSILTRTGVFRGDRNHAEYPADLVVDTVEEAVDYILRKERIL